MMNSRADMAYAILWPHWIITININGWRICERFESWAHKPLVKWGPSLPELNLNHCAIGFLFIRCDTGVALWSELMGACQAVTESGGSCAPQYYIENRLFAGPPSINAMRPKQNDRHFPDDIFKWIFVNENAQISIKISLKFVPRGPINNIPALVQPTRRQAIIWTNGG